MNGNHVDPRAFPEFPLISSSRSLTNHVSFPAMGLQRFPISDYRGGLNTKDGPFALATGEAQDLMNVTLTQRGVLDQRRGKTRFDSGGFPPGVNAENMRAFYRSDGARFLILSINGSIWKSDTAGALTRLFAGTPGTVWCFETAPNSTNADRLWAVNGVDQPQQWDGSAAATSPWTGAPTSWHIIRMWKLLMVAVDKTTNTQRLNFSQPGKPDTLPYTSFQDVRGPEDEVDAVTWLEVIGDYLIAFKKRSTWAVVDPATFQNRRLGAPGAEARFQSCVVNERLYFFSRAGVYSTDGVNEPRYESDKIEPTLIKTLNYSALDKVRLAPTRDRRVLMAVPQAPNTYNTFLFELAPDLGQRDNDDVKFGSWTMHDLPVASMCTYRPVDKDMTFGADAVDPKIHMLFYGSNDDGKAINAWWQGRWNSIVSDEPFERLRRVNIEMTGEIILDVYADFRGGPDFSAKLIAPVDTDPLWDGAHWDGGTWDPIDGATLMRARPETWARYHCVKFSNNVLDKTFTIYTTELAVRGGKAH